MGLFVSGLKNRGKPLKTRHRHFSWPFVGRRPSVTGHDFSRAAGDKLSLAFAAALSCSGAKVRVNVHLSSARLKTCTDTQPPELKAVAWYKASDSWTPLPASITTAS
jgi:hypothetical protein